MTVALQNIHLIHRCDTFFRCLPLFPTDAIKERDLHKWTLLDDVEVGPTFGDQSVGAKNDHSEGAAKRKGRHSRLS